MQGYSARDVADLLGVPVGQVRSFARAAALGGERFSFHDVALLRRLLALVSERVPPHKVRRALRTLQALSPSASLAQVSLLALGRGLAVRDDRGLWNPESRQGLLDFERPRSLGEVHPLAPRAVPAAATGETVASVDDLYDHACELEERSFTEARQAYARVLEADATHAPARINLGRLFHEAGELEAAEYHYRQALAIEPESETAAFNLGVVLEDRGAFDDAISAYERAIALDPGSPDPYYNLARLLERAGDRTRALRHLRTYRRLTRGR